MAESDWDLYDADDDASDAERAVPISPSLNVVEICPTVIEYEKQSDGTVRLVYARDTKAFLQQMVLGRALEANTATPHEQELVRRTIAGCKVPYRSDILYCGKFLKGRKNQDAESRKVLIAEALNKQPADPINYLRQWDINVIDSNNSDIHALLGPAHRRFSDLFELGSRPQQFFPSIPRKAHRAEISEEHQDHPRVVEEDHPKATRDLWAILPAALGEPPKRSAANKIGQGADGSYEKTEEQKAEDRLFTWDFAFAKAMLLAEPEIAALVDDSIQRIEGPLVSKAIKATNKISLHPLARGHIARIVDFAAERALCGPNTGLENLKEGASRRVARTLLFIAISEIWNLQRNLQPRTDAKKTSHKKKGLPPNVLYVE